MGWLSWDWGWAQPGRPAAGRQGPVPAGFTPHVAHRAGTESWPRRAPRTSHGAEAKGAWGVCETLFKRRHGTGSGHSCPLGQSKSHSQAQSLRSRDILATKHEAVAKEWMQRGVMLSAGPNRPDPKSPPLEEFEISLLKGFFLLHFLYHQLRF